MKQLNRNFHRRPILHHTLDKFVRMIQTKKPAGDTFRTNIKITTTAASAVVMNALIWDVCHTHVTAYQARKVSCRSCCHVYIFITVNDYTVLSALLTQELHDIRISVLFSKQ